MEDIRKIIREELDRSSNGYDHATLVRLDKVIDKSIQKMEQELSVIYNEDLLPGTIDDMAKIIQKDLHKRNTEQALGLYRGFRELI